MHVCVGGGLSCECKCPQRPEEGIGCPGLGVVVVWRVVPCRWAWALTLVQEPNPSHLKEHQILIAVAPRSHPLQIVILKKEVIPYIIYGIAGIYVAIRDYIVHKYLIRMYWSPSKTHIWKVSHLKRTTRWFLSTPSEYSLWILKISFYPRVSPTKVPLSEESPICLPKSTYTLRELHADLFLFKLWVSQCSPIWHFAFNSWPFSSDIFPY